MPSNPSSHPDRHDHPDTHLNDLDPPGAPAQTPPIVLSIAGYDPSAGAGVLADLKTFAALRVYGMACLTALTVQSTHGVRQVHPLDPGIVLETLDCLAQDVSFAAIKIGMLGSEPVAAAVGDWLARFPYLPVILDPILQSSSGKDLADAGTKRLLQHVWLARVQWITPNLAELAALTGSPLPATPAATEQAARKLQQLAADCGNPGIKIVVTGGHATRPDDFLLTPTGSRWYPSERIQTPSTHGTGCTFSSALAAYLARGEEDFAAVAAAKQYVTGALRHAYPIGHGRGPLDHFWPR